jgi:hypothetical protein
VIENEGSFYRYEGREPLEDRSELRFSDLVAGGTDLLIHQHLSGGDYSGNDGGSAFSNLRVWQRDFIDTLGILWWNVVGDFGSFGIAVRANLDEISEDDSVAESVRDAARSMMEALDGLDNYPLLDESDESNLQQELIDGQFPDMVRDDDFERRFLEPVYELIGADAPEEGSELDPTMDALFAFYSGFSDLFSIYPTVEGSGRNLSVVFYQDQWLKGWGAALRWLGSLFEPESLAMRTLHAKLIEALTSDETYKFVQYGRPLHTTVSVGHTLSRWSAEKVAVLEDRIEEVGPARATELLMSGQLLNLMDGGFSEFETTVDWEKQKVAWLEKFLAENRVPTTDPMFNWTTVANVIAASGGASTERLGATAAALDLAAASGERAVLQPDSPGMRKWAQWVLERWRTGA